MKKIEKEFNNSVHQNFDEIQQSLIRLFDRVMAAASNHEYCGLLNSNTWGDHYHKLSFSELFLMNLNDKEILGILNIAIYQAVVDNDYKQLLNGIFTYSRLRLLNRAYLSGPADWIIVEGAVNKDTELQGLVYTKSLALDNTVSYDKTLLLSRNLLRAIVIEPDLKNETKELYSKLIGEVTSKFDRAFLEYLYGVITGDYQLIRANFEEMEQCYSRCQWLSSGWYREAGLNKTVPVFLLGLYQLKNVVNNSIELPLKNEYLREASHVIRESPDYKPQILKPFEGSLQFLNDILISDFVPFYRGYRAKIEAIRKVVGRSN